MGTLRKEMWELQMNGSSDVPHDPSCLTPSRGLWTKIALKKGRSSPNDFEIGDRIVVQDVVNKRWSIKGTITQKRWSEDGSHRSFIVEKDDGTEIIRNAKFLKHEWQEPKPTNITWADQI